jgi:putative DNA primase/helicase
MKAALDTFEAACHVADAKHAAADKESSTLEIDRLAKLPRLEYERQRENAAKLLGVRVGALDKMVREQRAAAENDSATLPHWQVEPSSEPVDGAALLNSLRQVFRRYIVLPKGADVALALWVLHAWTFDAGEISPFMVLVSPTKRCGKTSVLILLYYLTPKSELASNISPTAIFRYIEETRPTLLIDEADSFAKDNEELRGILNSGHTKAAANVLRNIEVNGEHKPRRFSTWAPKAIATIRGLADTLEDRAIRLVLQRKAPCAKVERLRRRDNEWFAALRNQAARWAADNFDRLVDPDPKVPEALNDRAADNWRPLLAIADLACVTWPDEARRAALMLSGEDQDGAMGVELLKDIRSAFGDDDVIRSADLIAKLTADLERPWAEWKRGRPLTQKQLAGLLAPFCIVSINVNPPGVPQGKGYRRADFEDSWAVYCPGQNVLAANSSLPKRPSVQKPVESAQLDHFASVHEAPVDGSKNVKLSYSHAGLDGWTDRNGKNGADHGPDHDRDLGGICAQCARVPPDGKEEQFPVGRELVWLHPECWRFYTAAADDSLSRQDDAEALP